MGAAENLFTSSKEKGNFKDKIKNTYTDELFIAICAQVAS
jgi:hypothetical protein